MLNVATEPPLFNTNRSEEHTSELQSRLHLVCRLLLEKKKNSDKRCIGLPPAVRRVCLLQPHLLRINNRRRAVKGTYLRVDFSSSVRLFYRYGVCVFA